MGDAKIKRAWDMEHTVKQVLSSMRELVAGRNRTLVSLISRNTAGLGKRDIESALLQLDISVATIPVVKDSVVLPAKISSGRKADKGARVHKKPKEGSAISKLQAFFDEKWKSDPSWFDRHRGSEAITRKTRRWFGKTVDEIYTNGNVPAEPSRIHGSDWLFDRNVSSEGIQKRIAVMRALS